MSGRISKQEEQQRLEDAGADEVIAAARQLLQKGERSVAIVFYARRKSVSVSAATAVIDELIQQVRNEE